MRRLFLIAGAAAMALGAASVEASQGRGQGKGRGQAAGQAERARGGGQGADRNRGRGDRQERRAERRGERQERRSERRQERRAERQDRRVDRRPERQERRVERREERRGDRNDRRADRRQDRGEGRRERRSVRLTQRRAAIVREPAQIARLRFEPDRSFVRGCPPGLARRNNGCLPPGQERQFSRAWYDDWWGHGRSDDSYFYDSGYLYRRQPGGTVLGYLPLLGGALFAGNPWPAGFAAEPLPDYHVDYYGFEDPYDYRYADGVIYGLDPQTEAIQAVVALLTGDDWSVGQAMPAGYDVYNVPYDYRDQYADDADSWYRYSDGYVYEVDPTTQLVQAAIQLIT